MPSTILSDNGVTSNTSGIKVAGSNDGILELQTTTAGGAATTAMTINTSQAVTFAQTANLPNTFGFKNRIINGAMVIDQRNAGASVTPASSYTLDRWRSYNTQTSKFTVQQNAGSVTPPVGFRNYLGCTSSSAYSVTSSDYFGMFQAIEGFNFADMGWGTANAKTITISFWVRSSLTGTFGGALNNGAFDRSYPFSYTISAANTWEQKTVTISGDTTGTWVGATNGVGVYVVFGLGAGSTVSSTAGAWASGFFVSATGAVSVVGTNGATFYITGVQLEAGSTATSFDYRDYGRELIMCQRYYFKFSAVSSTSYFTTGWCESTTTANGVINFPVQLRTNPTSLEQSGTASNYRIVDAASATACSGGPTFAATQSANAALVQFQVASGLTIGRCVGFSANSTTAAFLAWSAEL